MGEIVPCVAILAVVFAHRTPLSLAQVGSPFLPGDLRLARFVQPFLLSDIHNHSCHFCSTPFPFYWASTISTFLTCLGLLFPLFVTGGSRLLLTVSAGAAGFSLSPAPLPPVAILRLVARFTPAALVEFVGTAASLFLKVNGGFFAISVCGSQLLEKISRASR